MISRRHFLQGTLVGVTGAIASVALATPDQVQAFTGPTPVALQRLPPLGTAGTRILCGADLFMRDSNGEYLPVGVVRSITINAPVDRLYNFDGEALLTSRGLLTGTLAFGPEW